MTRRLTLAAVAVLLAAWPALAREGGETRYYGPDGRYEGRATEDRANPQQRSLYDASGRYVGRVMTDDQGNARVYDNHGRYQGRATGGRLPAQRK